MNKMRDSFMSVNRMRLRQYPAASSSTSRVKQCFTASGSTTRVRTRALISCTSVAMQNVAQQVPPRTMRLENRLIVRPAHDEVVPEDAIMATVLPVEPCLRLLPHDHRERWLVEQPVPRHLQIQAVATGSVVQHQNLLLPVVIEGMQYLLVILGPPVQLQIPDLQLLQFPHDHRARMDEVVEHHHLVMRGDRRNHVQQRLQLRLVRKLEPGLFTRLVVGVADE